MLLDRVGLEQATDEIVAVYKAQRFAGVGHIVDLCCGIGGDSLALAARSTVTAVDWSPLRTAIAEHNARVYERSIATLTADVTVCRPQAEAVHIDPDRRAEGPRRHAIEAGSPDLQTLQQIVGHYVHAAIKLSPGADFKTIGLDAEIEVISHHGQCKQAVAWTGRFHQARRRATALPTGESISADAADDLAWPIPGTVASDKWLYEPNPAVVRADLVGVLAHKFGLAPVDPLIAYLVGDQLVDTALMAPFRVLEIADFSTGSVRQLLSRHDVGTLEIKSRGFAVRPEELRKLLRPRGSRPATLFLTRLTDRARAILAERPGHAP